MILSAIATTFFLATLAVPVSAKLGIDIGVSLFPDGATAVDVEPIEFHVKIFKLFVTMSTKM